MIDFSITPEEKELAQKLAKEYNYLPYMIERYLQIFGINETKKYLMANEEPLNPSIRVNELKISTEKLEEKLIRKGFKLNKIDKIPFGFEVLKESQNLGSLHEYLRGYFYLQGIASMYPPIILQPTSDDLVIDMAAAPGSKATELAQIMENEGQLILIEKNYQRIPSLELNLRRLGVKNSLIINYDSTKLSNLNLKADRILLDAPCTGEGLIRKDPLRKKSKSLEDLSKMNKIQKQLLKEGLSSLVSGGTLVYSTCSIAPEENEFVIDEILRDMNNFRILNISMNIGSPGLTHIFGKTLNQNLQKARRLYPHKDNTIGFFICLIEKT
ncbi:MAG: RsmB/NOP family class I SAM-dependent RNA methyltransferase [Candidatus Lokiarchaeota archaeon]